MTTKRKVEPAEDSEKLENGGARKLSEKMRGMITSISQEHIFTLSLESMVEPVTAEDSHHCERNWIEKNIKAQVANFRSPMKSDITGPKLLPSGRLASTVQNINSGLIEKGRFVRVTTEINLFLTQRKEKLV